MVAGKSPRFDKAHAIVTECSEAIYLAADKDLRRLPFRSPDDLKSFFYSKDNVEKLALYVLTYIAYGKSFLVNVLNALMTPALQNALYWSCTSRRTGREYVPPIVELFITHMAMAAHALQPNDGSTFNAEAFAKEARQAFHNTERNYRKRDLASAMQVAGNLSVSRKTETRSPEVKRARVGDVASSQHNSPNLYSVSKEIMDMGPGCKSALQDAVKKTVLTTTAGPSFIYEQAVNLLEVVKNGPDLNAVAKYVEDHKEQLITIPFPT